LDDNKLGIAVEKDGSWRFYPFQILVWHEIVNDNFNGEPILVTYCPLCGTGIVFKPVVEGKVVEFGTSGRLYNSNLVMYDRETDTLWSQQGGKAIVGKLTGEELEVRPADNVFWKEFKQAHPEAEVLSRDTGELRDYTSDPYGDYYSSRSIYFPVENSDDRTHPKTVVYGLKVGDKAKAYDEAALKRAKLLNDNFADTGILIVIEPNTQAARFFNRNVDDRLLTFEISDGSVLDKETGSGWNYDGYSTSGPMESGQLERLNPEFGFWFSWVAFNPETELYN
jgi:hypothetical protein